MKVAPVMLLAFNRPKLTRRVFQAIRRAKPSRLFLVADGPRAKRPEDARLCRETRGLQKVDWPCKVVRDFSSANLGCRDRIASGIDGVFRQVPEALILEDDCLPSPDFFRFGSAMLARYRTSPKVALVSGSSFDGAVGAENSYRFSRYTQIWGWGTWRRVWKNNDVAARQWPQELKTGLLGRLFPDDFKARRYWEDRLEMAWNGRINTWDFQFMLSVWRAQGLCVVPASNLVTNIGTGTDETHPIDDAPWLFPKLRPMKFPLKTPPKLEADQEADRLLESRIYSGSARLEPKSWLRYGLRRALGPYWAGPGRSDPPQMKQKAWPFLGRLLGGGSVKPDAIPW
jgi:hypothetical protein